MKPIARSWYCLATGSAGRLIADQLHDCLRRHWQADEPLEDFDQIEPELHQFFVAAEREALGREFSRFDRDVRQCSWGSVILLAL